MSKSKDDLKKKIIKELDGLLNFPHDTAEDVKYDLRVLLKELNEDNYEENKSVFD